MNGRPVIGARGGGTEELIEDGFDGLLFTPGEVTSLAHAISILGSDPDLLARMSRNATARNARRFSVDRQLNASIDIFAAATLARAHDEG